MTIDVVLTPAEIAGLPQEDLSATTCVVFDVLRATSSMLTALRHGAQSIVPVRTIEEAHTMKERRPAALLGGERHGEKIPGFDLGNSPFDYGAEVAGREIVWTTTNGTIALRACERAECVLVGAILNLPALVREIRARKPSRLLLVCAGTFTSFALEDAWGAGRLIELLQGEELTDSAVAALSIVQAEPDARRALQRSRNGRALAAKGRAKEVEHCAQQAGWETLGQLVEGRVVPIGHPGQSFDPPANAPLR